MRLSAIGFLLLSVVATAQVKSPADYLGYELGDQFTRHYQVVDYYQHLNENSPLVNVQEYGRTYEQRELLMAVVASEENMSRIETIRTDNLKRSGMLDGKPTTNVPIVWLSYNVHGNESSSTEASMATIYQLITEKKAWLDEVVVIIDPCINPDGRDRYVNFYWQYGHQPFNPNPQSLEHNEPWPGGRQNHYLFDLNRDWAWQTQIESRLRMKIYNEWMPQIHVDFHEQGYNSPYYFAPAAEPYHEQITDWQREFQDVIGRNNAKYFDENNWFYFTKQRFDLLYPSYGDSYPMFNGAIGMTYEQGGHSRAGEGVITQEGDTLTLLDRLTHHMTTGLSTVEMTVAHSEKVLSNFEEFFKTAPETKYKSFVLKTNDQDKLAALRSWLDINKIEYGSATGSKLSGYNYNTKRTESFSISSTDLVISTNQPKGVFANVLFEPETFVKDSLTYDITAWAVPYFYGIDAYATKTALSVNKKDDTPAFEAQETPANSYAFLFKWNNMEDARLLADLLKSGVKVRFTERSFTANSKVYDPGTLIVARRDNSSFGENFEQKITHIANQSKRKFDVIESGYMDRGPDIGSSDIRYLKQPKVAMLAGEGTSVLDYGSAWYYMEQELKYPFSALNSDDLSRADLDQFDVLIMTEGRYSNFRDSHLSKISDWVRAGGKLILIGDAIRKFADSDHSGISKFNDSDEKRSFEKANEKTKEAEKRTPYANRDREYVKKIVPGAIFKVEMENTHPLAFGYDNVYFSLKTSSDRYGLLESNNVGVINSKSDHISGFAGAEVKDRVGNSLIFGVESKGRGDIVYMVDNPLFRAFWYDAKLLMANAIFLVGQ
ncbi:MAG: zinc carboxypeptidase [Cyclobacteriaceae bacterium]